MEKIGLQALFEDRDFQRGLSRYIKGVDDAERATDKAAGDITKSADGIGKAWDGAGSTVALAAAGMGAALTAVLTKVTMTAARNQELAIVVETVGRNIGKTAKEMNGYVEGVKSMGITTQAARQSVIQMAQAQIDLEHSTELARLAQDAAVIGQINSSEAFEQLITGVQRGSLVMLRNIGITASFERAYAEAAQQLGKTTSQLTEQEKIQARVNEVLKNADQIAGTYEAAMGSAGKQMRSMTRYVEELEAEFGEALLPAFGAAVGAGTDFLKFLLDLPAPVKQTGAQIAALSAGLLTVAGSAAFTIPKILGLVKALQGLSVVSAVGLGPIGIAAGGLAALAGAFLYVKNLEEAHRDEAAAVIEASASYQDYVDGLAEAELGQYRLTRAIYERIKAEESGRQEDLARQYVDANKALESLLITTKANIAQSTMLADVDIGYFFKALERDVIPQLNEFQLALLDDEASVRQLSDALGLNATERERFIESLDVMVKAEQDRRAAIENELFLERERWRIWQDQTTNAKALTSAWVGLNDVTHNNIVLEAAVKDRTTQATDALEDQEDQIKAQEEALRDLNDALEDAIDAYKDIFDAMASGITDVRDVNQAISDYASDHKQKIGDLRRDLSGDIDAINRKYDDLLPDKTTVGDRMKMAGDAWDEWALRAGALMDGVQGDTEAGWAATIAAATQATGEFQREGETFQGYLERFVGDFYKNEYPGLINSATGVYSQHVAEKERLRAEDVADAQQRAQEQIAAENAAYQERQKQLEQQRAEKTLLGALELAEATGALQEFAGSTFPGAMGQILGDAGTFFDYYTSGMIELDAAGQAWVQNQEAGFLTVLNATQSNADNAKEAMLGFYQAGVQGAQANATELDSLQTKLADLTAERQLLQGEMKVLDPADLEDANTELGRINDQIADIQKQIEGLSDPFAIATAGGEDVPPEFAAVPEAFQKVIDIAPEMQDAVVTAFQEMANASVTAGDDILEKFINGSVIPDLIAGIGDVASAFDEKSESMRSAMEQAARDIIHAFERMKKEAVADVESVKAAIRTIPSTKTVKIEYVDPPPSGNLISAIEGAQLVTDAIEDIPSSVSVDVAFMPSIAEVRTIGENLGRALIDALHGQVKNSRRWVGQLLDVGQELEGVAEFLAEVFREDVIDPLDYMLEGFDEQLEFIRDRVKEIGEALGDLPEQTSIEDQYKDAQDDLDELNKMLEDQSFLQRLSEDQYAELLRKRGELEQQQAERRAQLEQERTDLLEQQKRLEEERNQLALERQQREEELLRLQEAQADLALLEQQFRLIDLLNEWKLDWRQILGGLELGVDVSVPDLLAAISRAMQAIAEQADEDLGIASPSKVFEEKGRMIREGLMKGLMEPVGNASQYAMPIPMTAPLQTGNTVNVAFGQTTINNGMDYEVFQAGVLRTVRDAIRYGG